VARLQAVYYRDRDGSEPFREFIAGLTGAQQAALKNQIGRLNSLTDRVPHLAFPHSSQVEGAPGVAMSFRTGALPSSLPAF
jgi:hypothetical protein